jgi:RNA polymerase sigma-70 factor (ECF subfamily)
LGSFLRAYQASALLNSLSNRDLRRLNFGFLHRHLAVLLRSRSVDKTFEASRDAPKNLAGFEVPIGGWFFFVERSARCAIIIKRPMIHDTPKTSEMLHRAADGDQQALADLFTRCEDRLLRMVQLRLDRRLQGRIDPADVVQEAYLEFARALPEYLRNPSVPFFLWLRVITGRKLQALHRYHLGTRARDAGREVSLHRGALPQASSVSLAAQLLGRFTSPSEAALRAELQIRVQEAHNSMHSLDREVLSLRHFEQLTNAETAEVLGIGEAAASNRFVRALKRLKNILVSAPGFFEESPNDDAAREV